MILCIIFPSLCLEYGLTGLTGRVERNMAVLPDQINNQRNESKGFLSNTTGTRNATKNELKPGKMTLDPALLCWVQEVQGKTSVLKKKKNLFSSSFTKASATCFPIPLLQVTGSRDLLLASKNSEKSEMFSNMQKINVNQPLQREKTSICVQLIQDVHEIE